MSDKVSGRRSPFRVLGFATVAMAATVVVAAGGVAGTSAMFQSTTTLPGATIKAGTQVLQVNGAASFTAPTAADLTPAAPQLTSFTVTNVGDTTVTVTAAGATTSSSAITASAQVAVGAVANTAACTAGTVGARAALNGYQSATLTTLTPGQSAVLCMELGLAAATPPAQSGQSFTYVLTLTSTQKQ